MKKILALLAAAVIASGSALAQGTFTFANFVGSVDAPASLNGVVADPALIGPDFAVEVWLTGGAAPLATQDFFASTAGAGYFVGPVVEVPGTAAGDTVNLTLRGFDQAGAYEGFTSFDVALGGGTLPPGDFSNMVGLDIVPVPEPSTIAMIALGLGAVALRFRRK